MRRWHKYKKIPSLFSVSNSTLPSALTIVHPFLVKDMETSTVAQNTSEGSGGHRTVNVTPVTSPDDPGQPPGNSTLSPSAGTGGTPWRPPTRPPTLTANFSDAWSIHVSQLLVAILRNCYLVLTCWIGSILNPLARKMFRRYLKDAKRRKNCWRLVIGWCFRWRNEIEG